MRTPIFMEEDNIDEEFCLSIYENSYDFYIVVLESFVKGGTNNLNELKQYFSEKNSEEYRIVVHGLKSSAASIGAVELSSVATDMDELYKSGDIEGMYSRHAELVKILTVTIDLIKVRLAQ